MNTKRILAAAAFLSAATLGATAQDSVSTAGGLPGDAVSPFDTGEQLNTYVVDTAPLITSWGTEFGIAPIAKSGKGNAAFFNNSISAQGMSATVLTNAPTPYATYKLWTGPGFGVNASENNAGSDVTAPPTSSQTAMTFSEFNADGGNFITTAVINYNPTNPSRLFVSRIQAATNGAAVFDNNAQFGTGSIDADGNNYFRADDFGTAGTDPISGNNVYRVSALDRNTAVLNQILGAGPSDGPSSTQLVTNSGDVHNPASNIPEDIAGRPVCLDSNFLSQFLYESSAGVMTTTGAHLGSSSDHRGNIAFSKAIALPAGNPVGTAGMYGQDGSGDTRNVQLWGVDANGAVTSTLTITVAPTDQFTDNDDGFVFPPNGGVAGSEEIIEYIHYLSQTAFRGGNGAVSVGQDQAGRILVATTGAADATTPVWPGSQNPINAIFVWRFNPGGGGMVKTLAAYTDPTDSLNGKDILDGPGGNVIGRCVYLDEVTGGNVPGPSMSAPMIDSAGNIWFQSSVELDGNPSDLDTALLRAVYSATTFSYELELVMQLGQTIRGPNSDRDYQVTFMGISDSNSIDSNACWSGNIVQSTFNDYPLAGLATKSPFTLGGIVVNAEITYDWNDDGVFDPTGGLDQDYQAMLYIGPNKPRYQSNEGTYCTAGVSFSGCTTNLSTTGISSVSASTGFVITGPNSEGAKSGLFYWGMAQKTPPTFVGTSSSYQCVNPPVKRSQLLSGGGSNGNCDGTFSIDLNARWYAQPAQKPAAGSTLYGQIWYRDPSNTSNQTTSRSDALKWDATP